MAEEKSFRWCVAKCMESIFATACFVLDHLHELEAQERISMTDYAWIHRNLERLDKIYREGPHVDTLGVVGDSQIKDLINKAHLLAGELETKLCDEHSQIFGPVEMLYFPEGLHPRLYPVYNQLMDIVIGLDAVKNKPRITHRDVGRLQLKLSQAEERFRSFPFTEKGDVPEGQASISDMIEEVHDMIYDLVMELPEPSEFAPAPVPSGFEEEEVDPVLVPLKEKLEGIIYRLHDLKSKPLEWIGTVDVGHEQVRLHDVDEQYSEARFMKRGKVPKGQAVVTELLEKAHDLASEIVSSLPETEEAVDPEARCHGEMRHIAHRLRRIIRDLKALRGRKGSTAEATLQELGRLQNKLSFIDDKYQDAHFQFGQIVPEGQAYVSSLLAIAHAVAQDVRFELEEEDEEDGGDEASLTSSTMSNLAHDVSKELSPVLRKLEHYEKLLVSMLAMPAESISTRDVGRVQNSIHKIDERYNMGRIAIGGNVPEGQAIISEKLNRVHELVHVVLCRLPLEDEERVDDSLLSAIKKLDHLMAELMKLRSLPEDQVTTKDVGRIQVRLSELDKKYSEGKFKIGGEIPTGQAIIAEKLYDAHELAHELLVNMQ